MDKYYIQIKNTLINNEIYKKVKDYSKNKNDLESYYLVGKLIFEAQGGEKRAKYGDNLIKKYSILLTKDLNKKYSVTSLKYMRQFYMYQKSQPLADQLTWSHYQELLPLKDINKINYYINRSIELNLSRNKLRKLIKSKEYERLNNDTKFKLINNKETDIIDLVKDPIIIKNNKYEIISEKILQQLIMEDISSFLKQLGNGFTFIDNEYPIKIGNNYNYIDLLLFNYIHNCFIVIELKITELKKEHIGQIEVYMNYINNHLKTNNQNNTIGIIIVKKDNKYILEYCSDNNIFSTKYVII